MFETAGQKRKFFRNMRHNVSARQLGIMLYALAPIMLPIVLVVMAAIVASHTGHSKTIPFLCLGSLRNQPAYIADINAVTSGYAATGIGAAQEQGLVNRIPLDKPLFGLLLEVRYRAATGATAPGATLPEAAQNYLQRVRVVGTHKRYGTRELVNVRGATLYMIAQKYQSGLTPETVSNLPAAGANPAINTNYDVLVELPVYFVPPGIPKAQQALFLVRNDEWTTFDVYTTFGDASSIWTFGGGQVVTFTDYASAAGVPRVRVSTIKTLLGTSRNLIRPAVFRQQFLNLTAVLTAANLSDAAIQDLTIGFKVHNYLVKLGVQYTGTAGAGNFAFSSLSDGVITRAKVKLDTAVIVRDFISPNQARQWTKREIGTALAVGYIPLDFCEGGDINTAFRGDRLTLQNKLQLAGDVTAAANQVGEVVESFIEGDPTVSKAA